MKTIMLVILVFFMSYAFAEERQKIELPKAKPKITVVNSEGESLLDDYHYEFDFKYMSVFVKKDMSSSTSYYIPKTKCDAFLELKKLLPESYYDRLTAAYDGETERNGGLSIMLSKKGSMTWRIF